MGIWFTADEHYGHNNVIAFCKRPFSDLGDMRAGLIRRHNEVVMPGDLVYHIGDMFWRTLPLEDALSVMKSLNGQHYYVRGNHEELIDEHQELRDCFVWVKERAHIHPEGGPRNGIVLDHFAGRVWHRSDKGSWQLYGHSHGDLYDNPNLMAFDIGVDTSNYYPVSLEQVRERMEERSKWIQHRFGGSKSPGVCNKFPGGRCLDY